MGDEKEDQIQDFQKLPIYTFMEEEDCSTKYFLNASAAKPFS